MQNPQDEKIESAYKIIDMNNLIVHVKWLAWKCI